MPKRTRRAAALAAILCLLGLGMAGGVLAAGETLRRSAVLAGGGSVAAGPVALRAAVAQPVAGRVARGEISLCAGIACLTAVPPAQGGTVHTVTISGFDFAPDPLEIAVGDTVVWQRLDGEHSVQADDGSFSSGAASSAWSTFQHTFTAAGVFGYHCAAHGAPGSGMHGTVIVGAALDSRVYLPHIQQ